MDFKNVTLPYWAAWYGSCGKSFHKKSTKLDIDLLPLETAPDDDSNDNEQCDNTILFNK